MLHIVMTCDQYDKLPYACPFSAFSQISTASVSTSPFLQVAYVESLRGRLASEALTLLTTAPSIDTRQAASLLASVTGRLERTSLITPAAGMDTVASVAHVSAAMSLCNLLALTVYVFLSKARSVRL